MIKRFLISAIRHLMKHRSYAALNIAGLSIGLACFCMIALWVKAELTYDAFHQKSDRIYRVANLFRNESGQFAQAVTPIPLAPAILADVPEVEDAVRIDINDATVMVGDKQFVEEDILAVDASFFTLFDFRLVNGAAESALEEPYNVVLSARMARKYFGDANPIGQVVKMFLFDRDGNGAQYKVTGVIEDCPPNSHFNYNFLVSFKTFETAFPGDTNDWFSNGYYTYLLVRPDANMGLLKEKFSSFLDKYIGKEMRQYNMRWTYFLQPLTGIHLNSDLRYEIKPTSSVSNVVIFGTIGFIVLVLACINFINLSTAYAAERAREVGIRKVMGAFKHHLVFQYLAESWLLAIISLLVAFTWIELARPLFETLTDTTISGLYTLSTLVALVAIASVTGLVSGLYPSVFLSSFKTLNILKGRFRAGSTGVGLRKALVVFQYTVTIILITGILVVRTQLQFMKNTDLGFNEQNLLILNVNGSREVMQRYDAFAAGILSVAEIKSTARSNTMITGGLSNSDAVAEDASGKLVNATLFRLRVDHDYLITYGMQLLAGRNFMIGSAFDSTHAFIVNEETTKIYGYANPADMVGKKFALGGMDGQVIGVVKDFHYSSLQQRISPVCMSLLGGNFSKIAVRMNGDLKKNVEKVADAWKKYFPDSVFDYAFAEDSIQEQYVAEQHFSKIYNVFSIISLVIACLGLFSLVSYTVEGRTKEIGVRKVLGASVGGIVTLISREFLFLIFISCAIAIPLAYYFTEQWLQGFAYRIDVDAWVFVAACLTASGVALATISMKSIKCALANPVDALRNE